MKSIRRTLALWLAFGLASGIAIVLGATYFFSYQELSRVFDFELKQIAEAVRLTEDAQAMRRLRIARPGFGFSVRAYNAKGEIYFETALPSLPEGVPVLFHEGFTTFYGVQGEVRIFTHVTAEGIVQVAQLEADRAALARELSLRMAMPTLLLVPLLVGLVVIGLARGLAPLQWTSRRVSDRDAKRLDPLPTQDVPVELMPLILQINALLARLAESLETQRRFVADAAHELRSPVAALALQAQVAERAATPEARDAAYADLKQGIARAGRLVEQLLDLARLEPGVREPLGEVDLSLIAREVVGSYAARADERDVDLGADAPQKAPLLGVESEMRSLVTNLVDNAIRYAPPQSEVTVSVRPVDSAVELVVADAGPGIPSEERERVFKRFERVAGDPTPGSGLGLPIVKAVVERHEGTLTLEDAQPNCAERGLLVRVRLPVNGSRSAGSQ
ncbi:MAG TPA: ATP-binding protein [Burkholderiales bacterium]|nr:ATP-binding protein [Burkholderiales bacterium]